LQIEKLPNETNTHTHTHSYLTSLVTWFPKTAAPNFPCFTYCPFTLVENQSSIKECVNLC